MNAARTGLVGGFVLLATATNGPDSKSLIFIDVVFFGLHGDVAAWRQLLGRAQVVARIYAPTGRR